MLGSSTVTNHLKRMKYLLLLRLLLIAVSLIAHVSCAFVERRFIGYYRNATLCGSLLGFSSNYSTTQVPTVRSLTDASNELKLECLNGGRIILTEATFGIKQSARCPQPTSFLIEVSNRYCDSLRTFFRNLHENCSLSEEFIRTNVSGRYGDLEDPVTCGENPNQRLRFSGGFCRLEQKFFTTIAKKFEGVDGECLVKEFQALFPGCKKSSTRTSKTWVETRTTRNVVNSKCASQQKCILNMDKDFPARFALETFSSQSLFITYRCNSVRHKYRPSFDKRARLGKITLWWRLKRPPSVKFTLTAAPGAAKPQQPP